MGSSRYDRHRAVGKEEYEESRALHAVAALLGSREHDLVHSTLTGAVGNLFDVTAIELGNGRVVTPPVRLAVRRLAYDIQRHLHAAESSVRDVERGRGPGTRREQ